MGLILAAPTLGVDAAAEQAMTPFERAISTPRGQLKNPYPDFASVAAEGLKIYRSHDCNGCHGGGGGGGMAAPLTNQIWIYGNDDDTLFRVITLGTGVSAQATRSGSKGSCARAPRTSSGRCPPSAKPLRPMMMSGKLSLGLGRFIASDAQRDADENVRIVPVCCRPHDPYPSACQSPLLMLWTAPSTGTSVPWLWGAVNAPTIRRSQSCKRSQPSVST